MIGHRAIIGLCTLCALLVSAFAAQSAGASTTGTTGTAPAGTGYTGNITAEAGETRLHAVINGIFFELKSTSFTGTGTAASMVEASEHTTNGTGTGEFQNVTVVSPAGKGCAVVGGKVFTNELKATTAGQGMGLKVEPVAGPNAVLAEFEVEGCGTSAALMALNGPYELTGSVVGTPTEGTNEVLFTAAGTTAQNTMKLRGFKAGINGAFKFKTSGGVAIKSSTVVTP